MGSQFMICALVLVVGHLCSAQDVDILIDSNDHSTVKSQLSATVDGQHVVEKSVADKECRVHLTRAEFDDHSVNTVVDDLEDDTGLVLFSDIPDTCFVRHVDKTKEKCQNGYAVPDEGESNNDDDDDVPESENNVDENNEEVTTEEKATYKDGEVISVDRLPAKLQKLCAGRKIIHLVETQEGAAEEATADDGDAPTSGPPETGVRRKRWLCFYFTRCFKTTVCKRGCFYGWWRRRPWVCSRYCTTHTTCRRIKVGFC